MKYKRLATSVTAFALMFSAAFSPNTLLYPIAADNIEAVTPFSHASAPQGIFYRTGMDSTFLPSNSASDIQQQLQQLVDDTAAAGLNTIFFEAKPSSYYYSDSDVLPNLASEQYAGLKELDCLAQLTQLANQKNIQVFAVIDSYVLAELGQAQNITNTSGYRKYYQDLSFSDSEGRLLLDPSQEKSRQMIIDYSVELLKNYPIAGVVFEGLFDSALLTKQQENQNFVAEFLSLMKGSMPEQGQKLGIVLPYTGAASDAQNCLLAKNLELLGVIDFTMANLTPYETTSYEQTIDTLEQHFSGATLYPLNVTTNQLLDDDNFIGDDHQLGYRICYNTVSGITGFSMDDTAALSEQAQSIAGDLHSDYAAIVKALSELDLDFAHTLSVTRPDSALSTTYSRYFIMGTSDPDQDLTMDGEEVPRYGTEGAFGILVSLELGVNEFVFQQGDETVTVEITRKEPATGTSPISQIVQSSIYPSVNDVTYGGGKIEFQCTAPAGATVTGTVAGLSVTLRQTGTAQNGTPAVFYGSIDVPEKYNIDSVTNLGPLEYTMNYGGVTSSYTSNANLYVAGENTTVKVQVNGYRANVYNKLDDGGNFTTTLSEGAVDWIDQQDFWSASGVPYFYLSCGGYIPKSNVTILEGNPDISNPVSSITLEQTQQGEVIRVSGVNLPSHRVARTEEGIAVHLYNTTYSGEAPDLNGSTLMEKINLFPKEGELLLDIYLKDPLWGYDIQYDGTDTLIFLKTPPAISDDAGRPLAGTVIVLDPGHGDIDCGALGVAGLSGATENTLNFAVATATKLRLEQLGATVYMTRDSVDGFLELDERMQFAEEYYPDFFLSIHHNSVGETTDANEPEGAEIYYHTAYSQQMAENVLSYLCENVERKYRDAYSSYYRVTRITCAPAALLEVGFVPNPAEYEQLCDISTIIKTANGICQGIIASIPGEEAETIAAALES